MEACPKVPMLSFDPKMCNYEVTNFTEKIFNYIYSHYQENPESFQKELNELIVLRENAVNASKDFMGLNILKKYFHQLQFLSNRFPMKSGEECEIEFSWNNLYNEKDHTYSDVRFEQQCILYNIAAMHSYLGCIDSRKNDDGIKISCTHFQYAAWAFRTVRDTYAAYDFTGDLNEFIISFKMNIMLAQAQECVLEKSIIDNRKTSINAKISCQIVEFYRSAVANIDNPEVDIDFKIKKDWIDYCYFKVNFYTALSNYFLAISSADSQKYGDSVGFIQVAEEHLKRCTKIKNFKELQEPLKFTQECIETKSKLLRKDNDFVYHEKITAENDLSEIKGVTLVKCLPIDFDAIDSTDIFIRLVSMKAHELSSLYSEEKAKLLRQINDQVTEKNTQLEQFMAALQINQLHLDNFDYLKLPKELLECCASISVRPTLITEDIPKAMKSIVEVTVHTKEILADIEDTIEAEQKQHRQESLGDDSLSDTSSSDDEEDEKKMKPTKSARKMRLREISKRYDLLQKNFMDANASNIALHEAFNSVTNNLQVLSLPLAELSEKLPEIEAINNIESKEIRDKLVSLLEKVEEMKSQREELVKRFQRAIQGDDLTKTIASHQNDITNPEQFFQDQLKKHDQLVTYLQQNLQAQDNILRALADSNALFTTDRKAILGATQQRNAFIDGLVFSYQSVNELIEKANRGVTFFENLNEPLKTLLKDAKEFCEKSREERQAKRNFIARFSSGQQKPFVAGQRDLQSRNYPPMGPPNPQEPGISNSNQQPQPQINPTCPDQLMSGLSLNERPKLKDFLPNMKPQSWGNKLPNSDTVTKNFGPPVMDRSNFGLSGNISQPQVPMQKNVGPPVMDRSSFGPFGNTNQQQKFPMQNFNNSSHQDPRMNVKMQQQQLNRPQTAMANPGFSIPFRGNMAQYQMPPARAPSPLVIDPQQKILEQQLIDQHMKEKELALKKQQLDEQERQFKLQQQQFMLQQQQQQKEQQKFIMEQEKKLQMQQAAHSSYVNNQLPGQIHQIKGGNVQHSQSPVNHNQTYYNPINSVSNQYYSAQLQQTTLQPGVNNFQNAINQTPVSQFSSNQNIVNNQFPNQNSQNNQLYQMDQNKTNEVTSNSQNPNNELEQQQANMVNQYGRSHQQQQQLSYQPSQNGKPQLRLNDQMDANQVSKSDAVYKPGFYSQFQMEPTNTNPNQHGIPVKPLQMLTTNTPPPYQVQPFQPPIFQSNKPTNVVPPQTKPSQNSNPPIQSIIKPPVIQKPTSAIDDLLDIFDGGNLSNVQVLQPQTTQNKSGYIENLNLSNVSSAASENTSIYEIIKAEDLKKSQASLQKTEKEPEIEDRTNQPEDNTQSEVKPIPKPTQTNKLNFLNNPIQLEHFLSEVQKLENHVNALSNKTLASVTLLEKEWKDLNDYQEKQTSMTISVARCYPNKNRFQDLLPFDQTRIVLKNKTNDDYINATSIGRLITGDTTDMSKLIQNQPNFIVAQAPILTNPSDLYNFWSMIIQQQIELVCCMSRDSELLSGEKKSGQNSPTYYWPVNKDNPLNVMSLKIVLMSMKETTYSIKRICSVMNLADSAQKVRTVVILQYKYGPNTSITSSPQSSGFGLNEMPENMTGFLKFTKECEQFYSCEQRNVDNPILVHCMNGVSRSAVLLLTYSLIQIIDAHCDHSLTQISTISESVIRLIKHMRTKRKYMIQSTYHLKYSYDAILYYLKDILIKQGILTNLTSKNKALETSEKPNLRQHSVDSIDILNDVSLVSIQDSTVQQSSSKKLEEKSDEKSVHSLESFELEPSNSSNISVTDLVPSIQMDVVKKTITNLVNLEDLCNPNKFTLEFNEETTKPKQKITKNDFFKVGGGGGQEKSNDPFLSLDPLRKQ